MSSIKLIREQEAGSRVKAIYDDIKAAMGWKFVPETFQLMAHNPDHLEAYWEQYKRAMSPGKLDLKTKEIIAYLVSTMNSCDV